jgi:hypothetical protein
MKKTCFLLCSFFLCIKAHGSDDNHTMSEKRKGKQTACRPSHIHHSSQTHHPSALKKNEEKNAAFPPLLKDLIKPFAHTKGPFLENRSPSAATKKKKPLTSHCVKHKKQHNTAFSASEPCRKDEQHAQPPQLSACVSEFSCQKEWKFHAFTQKSECFQRAQKKPSTSSAPSIFSSSTAPKKKKYRKKKQKTPTAPSRDIAPKNPNIISIEDFMKSLNGEDDRPTHAEKACHGEKVRHIHAHEAPLFHPSSTKDSESSLVNIPSFHYTPTLMHSVEQRSVQTNRRIYGKNTLKSPPHPIFERKNRPQHCISKKRTQSLDINMDVLIHHFTNFSQTIYKRK